MKSGAVEPISGSNYTNSCFLLISKEYRNIHNLDMANFFFFGSSLLPLKEHFGEVALLIHVCLSYMFTLQPCKTMVMLSCASSITVKE